MEVSALADIPVRIEMPSPRFVCLVAMDATLNSQDELAALAKKLLSSGAVYVCAWGPGCDAVGFAVDLEYIGPNPPPVMDKVVMTTTHSTDLLEDAIWFALNCAWPDEAYWDGCDSMLGLVVGNTNWATEVRTALEDPRRFTASVVAKEGANDAV